MGGHLRAQAAHEACQGTLSIDVRSASTACYQRNLLSHGKTKRRGNVPEQLACRQKTSGSEQQKADQAKDHHAGCSKQQRHVSEPHPGEVDSLHVYRVWLRVAAEVAGFQPEARDHVPHRCVAQLVSESGKLGHRSPLVRTWSACSARAHRTQ